MPQHVTLHIHAHNEHSVLQRLLLNFSRRRLRIQALQMFDLQPHQPAEIQIDLSCDTRTLNELLGQIRRIVEVDQVWSECVAEPSADVEALSLRVA